MHHNILNKITKLWITFALCITFNTTAYSQGEPPQPPQEAVEACASKADGDVCSFTGPRNDTLSGTCRKGPQGEDKLACAPRPPQEAIEACSGKIDEASCSFVSPKGDTINGACRKGPPGVDELACHPGNEMPHPMQMEDANKPAEEED